MLSSTKSRLAGKTFIQTVIFFFLVSQISFAQGSWTHIGDMPEIRLAHTANELDGKIYIVGGMNTEQGQLPTTVLVYDRSDTNWTTLPLLNNEFRTAHTSRVADGKLYVIGGWTTDGSTYVTSSKVDMYDPNTSLWTSKNPMPTHRENIASALIDGKIYVMGGLRTVGGVLDYTGLKTLEVYDVSADTWTPLADMPTGRWGLSAVAFNGKIYVFGGTTGIGTTVYASVQVYDPQTNTWTVKSNMPTARYQLTTCVLNNYIYAIDGWFSSDNGPIYDKVEVYNPESDTWYTEIPMPVARALLASVVLDGKIQVFGGSSTLHPLIGSSGIYEFSNNEPLPVGTYTIGSGGYFSSIQSAFDKLSTDGVSGAVSLELIDELYTAPTDSFGFKLNGPIPGAGPNSRVTIFPNFFTGATVEGSGAAVFTFLNTSYTTLIGTRSDGVFAIHTISNNMYSQNDGIIFQGNSDNNILKYLAIANEDYIRGGVGIGLWGSSTSQAACDSNLIQNNYIQSGIGIYINTISSLQKATGNIISGNSIGSESDSLTQVGIQIEKTKNTIIENNVIQNIRDYGGVSLIPGLIGGINSYDGEENIIRNNIVHNVFSISCMYGTVGIGLSGGPNQWGNNESVYNNMVYNIRSLSTQPNAWIAGIQMWYQSNTKIYYNTVYLSGNGNGANPFGSAALYINALGGPSTNVDLKNNIFVNTRDESPYCASAIIDYTAANLTSDYNDLYYDDANNNNCLVRIGNIDYLTLANWQATGKDLNSISEMPHFVAPDLHIDDYIFTLLDGGATPIVGIETDIDGGLRNEITPDIGADEFDIVGVEDETTLPTEFTLEQNYPNPFNPQTSIQYAVSSRQFVSLKIYDILGNEIVTLVNEEKSAGNYSIEFNASALPSGVYFYQLKAGNFIETKKMLLLK